jgi:hypothetical protein
MTSSILRLEELASITLGNMINKELEISIDPRSFYTEYLSVPTDATFILGSFFDIPELSTRKTLLSKTSESKYLSTKVFRLGSRAVCIVITNSKDPSFYCNITIRASIENCIIDFSGRLTMTTSRLPRDQFYDTIAEQRIQHMESKVILTRYVCLNEFSHRYTGWFHKTNPDGSKFTRAAYGATAEEKTFRQIKVSPRWLTLRLVELKITVPDNEEEINLIIYADLFNLVGMEKIIHHHQIN